MELEIIKEELSVCKVADYSGVDFSAGPVFIGKTSDENSLVCPVNAVPSNVTDRDDGWRAFRIRGVLDFSLIGILSKIAGILAENKIGIFAVSTYNTDYILTKSENFERAIKVLEKEGYVAAGTGLSATLKRAYVEITNVCNLKCSFCPGTKRKPQFMSAADFRTAAGKLRRVTEYIYLHIMGEPLLHPELAEILDICSELNFKVNITTNGVLLPETGAMLTKQKCIRKVSVSLHSFEGNGGENPEEYLESVWKFASEAPFIVALRLWNEGGENRLNGKVYDYILRKTGVDARQLTNYQPVVNKIYIESEVCFDWPDVSGEEKNVTFCHGLTGQIGVLCDGTVVPCCLDSEGTVNLGNILRQDVDEILNSERAKAMVRGFRDRCPSEELCRHCGYGERFVK